MWTSFHLFYVSDFWQGETESQKCEIRFPDKGPCSVLGGALVVWVCSSLAYADMVASRELELTHVWPLERTQPGRRK